MASILDLAQEIVMKIMFHFQLSGIKILDLDLIGREYCRDRSIKCEKQEGDTLMIWQQAKGQLIMAHEEWKASVINSRK